MVLTHALPLVPVPASVTAAEGRMPITAQTRVGGDSPAVAQLIDAVDRRTGIRMQHGDGGEAEISLRVDPGAGAAEGYALTVEDAATVTGSDEAGLFYGVQTLLQLLREDADAGCGILRATISDAPRFAYRGVMLDVARHFFGVDDVKRCIDSISALKLNRLHLHLSDDQGWRVQIDSWPLLAERASTSSVSAGRGGFYTKADYREIVEHAAAHHVIVVPEIDLPGHTHAIGVAYPELVEPPVVTDEIRALSAQHGQPLPVHGQPYSGWAVGHSSIRIHEPRADDFVRDVMRELAEMTPGPYIHIGGDESLGTPRADFDHFATRATQIVVDAGKTPVAWHEMGSAAGIAEGTIGQYWGSTVPDATHAAEAARFVERGGSLIMSASNVAYLDMKYTPDYPLGLDWAGTVDVQKAYGWEPTAVLDVPDAAILGVEAPLWSETTRTYADAEQLIFPRVAAQAEIAWSPRDGEARAWDSFRERLGTLAPLWKAEGVAFHASAEIPWSDR